MPCWLVKNNVLDRSKRLYDQASGLPHTLQKEVTCNKAQFISEKEYHYGPLLPTFLHLYLLVTHCEKDFVNLSSLLALSSFASFYTQKVFRSSAWLSPTDPSRDYGLWMVCVCVRVCVYVCVYVCVQVCLCETKGWGGVLILCNYVCLLCLSLQCLRRRIGCLLL